MPSYLSDAMLRIPAMQRECLSPLKGTAVDAVGYWLYQQEAFPYWTNRLANTDEFDYGEDQDTGTEDIEWRNYTVLMRLIVGHYTEGYKGEPQTILYEYIPLVEQFFAENPMLTSTLYPTDPDYLHYEAQLTNHSGIVAFQNGGIGVTQIGCEFTLIVPYVRQVY